MCVAAVCGSTVHRGSLTQRDSQDTFLFPKLGRLLHSEEFPRDRDEPPSAQLLAGAPGLHVAT